MLSNLTWTEYSIGIFLSAAIYYLAVLIMCYRPQIKSLISGRTKVRLKFFAGDPGDLNLPNETEDHDSIAVDHTKNSGSTQ